MPGSHAAKMASLPRMPAMPTLVLLRHGQSQWNMENRFTGWADVDLSDLGRQEAREAGELLKREGFDFDHAHTSVLKRAVRDRKSTRLNSSHPSISYAVFCLKKKKKQ